MIQPSLQVITLFFIVYFRNHHHASLRNVTCNESLMTDHTNICVIAEECSKGITYSLNNCQAFRALCIMRSRKTAKAWTCLVGVKSIAIIETLYNAQVWKKLWSYITKYYDCA